MKNIATLFTLLSLLIHTQYSLSMYEQINNVEDDNKEIIAKITYALKVLQPSLHQTIQERYNELIKEYQENPYSIITQTPSDNNFNNQIIQELQEIEYAYQAIIELQLENQTRAEIHNMIINFITISIDQALNTLGLSRLSSKRDIEDQYNDFQKEYVNENIEEEHFEDITEAYNFLRMHYLPTMK